MAANFKGESWRWQVGVQKDRQRRYLTLESANPADKEIPIALQHVERELKLSSNKPLPAPTLTDPISLADYLVLAAPLGRSYRAYGPFTSSNWTPATPKKTIKKPAPAELRIWNAQIYWAKVGGSRDPDNGFWDWYLATTFLSLGRDAEALEALGRAARKPHFTDPSALFPPLEFRVRSKLRPLTLEEVATWYAEQYGIGGLNRYNQAALVFMEIAYLRHLSGREREAVDIAQQVFRVGEKMYASAQTSPRLYIASLVMEVAVLKWRPLSVGGPANGPSISAPDNLAYFARRQGRSALTKATLNFPTRDVARKLDKMPFQSWSGVSSRQFAISHWFNSALRWLVASLPWLFLPWLGITISSRSKSQSAPSMGLAWEPWLIAVAGCISLPILLGLSWGWDPSSWDRVLLWPEDFSHYSPFLTATLSLSLMCWVTLTLVNVRVVTQTRREQIDRLQHQVGFSGHSFSEKILWIVPLLPTLTLVLVVGFLFWMLPNWEWPQGWELISNQISMPQLWYYSPFILPTLCLLQILPWLRQARWRTALPQAAAHLHRAIPLYLAINFLVFGLALFPITAMSNQGVAKFTTALNKGEVNCRRAALNVK